MFARLFPMSPERIIRESFFGILQSLILLPIARFTPDIGDGLSGMYSNIKLRLMFPFDENEREKYRNRMLNGEFRSKPWQMQVAYDHLLLDSKYGHIHRAITSPIIEELIFRGLLMPFISYVLEAVNIDPSYSIIISALAFGLGHRNSIKLPATCAGYMFANMVTNNDGSLWSSIAGHISHNTIDNMIYSYQEAKLQQEEEILHRLTSQYQIGGL